MKEGTDVSTQDKKRNQSNINVTQRIAPKVGGNPPGTEFNVLPQAGGKLSSADLANAKFIIKKFYPISILDANNSTDEPPIRIVIPALGIDFQ